MGLSDKQLAEESIRIQLNCLSYVRILARMKAEDRKAAGMLNSGSIVAEINRAIRLADAKLDKLAEDNPG